MLTLILTAVAILLFVTGAPVWAVAAAGVAVLVSESVGHRRHDYRSRDEGERS